jgi:hypothetical protein
LRSTIAPAPVASFEGKVASGVLRWNVTFCPLASTDFIVESRGQGPCSSFICITRLMENATSAPVILSPLENVTPLRSVQLYVSRSVPSNPQRCAASPVGTVELALKVSSDW